MHVQLVADKITIAENGLTVRLEYSAVTLGQRKMRKPNGKLRLRHYKNGD